MTRSDRNQRVLSFMSANYVADELGYGAADDWGPFDAATNAAFAPLDTFAERFDGLLTRIAAAGFDHLDLWLAHLNWQWATAEHIEIARLALERHDLELVSLAGNFGGTAEDLDAACRLATALGVDVLGGMGAVLTADRLSAESVLRSHGVRFAYENHPEKTPQDALDVIGEATDVLGVAIDTGWWATQGYDPVDAITELSDRIFYVHLKDVEQPGGEHVTVPHGTGCVDIVGCVDALISVGYAGAFSIEHEPYDHDPTTECVEMRERLHAHLEAAGTTPR